MSANNFHARLVLQYQEKADCIPMAYFATYLINLESSSERRTYAQSAMQAANLKAQIIPAVDGRHRHATDFDIYDEGAAITRHGRALIGGEVGCYLSHIAAIDAFLASNSQFALVLEDDATIPLDAKTFVSALIDQIEISAPDWDIIHLSNTRSDFARDCFKIEGHLVRRSYFFPMVTTALIWSRQGAQTFRNSRFGTSIRGPVDTELRSFCARRGRGFSLDAPPFPARPVASDINTVHAHRRNGPRVGSPLKSKIMRHFPDYMATYWNMLLR